MCQITQEHSVPHRKDKMVSLFVLTGVGGLVLVSILFVLIFVRSFAKSTQTNPKQIITNGRLTITQLTRSVQGLLSNGLYGMTTLFISIGVVAVILFLFFTVVAVGVNNNNYELQQAGNFFIINFWQPLVDIVYLILVLLKEIATALAATWNAYKAFCALIVNAIFNRLSTCGGVDITYFFSKLSAAFQVTILKISDWAISRFFAAPLDVYSIVRAFQEIVPVIQEPLNCLCQMFDWLWQLIIQLLTQNSLANFLHNLVNIFISNGTELFNMVWILIELVPEVLSGNFGAILNVFTMADRPPQFLNTAGYVFNTIWYLGRYLDDFAFNAIAILTKHIPIYYFVPFVSPTDNVTLTDFVAPEIFATISSGIGFMIVPWIVIPDAVFHADQILIGSYREEATAWNEFVFETAGFTFAGEVRTLVYVNDFEPSYYLADILESGIKSLFAIWETIFQFVIEFYNAVIFTIFPDPNDPKSFSDRVFSPEFWVKFDQLRNLQNQFAVNVAAGLDFLGSPDLGTSFLEFSHVALNALECLAEVLPNIDNITYIQNIDFQQTCVEDYDTEVKNLALTIGNIFRNLSFVGCEASRLGPHGLDPDPHPTIYTDPVEYDIFCSIGNILEAVIRMFQHAVQAVPKAILVVLDGTSVRTKIRSLFGEEGVFNIGLLLLKPLERIIDDIVGIIFSFMRYIYVFFIPAPTLECPSGLPYSYTWEMWGAAVRSVIKMFLFFLHLIETVQIVVDRVFGAAGVSTACPGGACCYDELLLDPIPAVGDCICFILRDRIAYSTTTRLGDALVYLLYSGECLFSGWGGAIQADIANAFGDAAEAIDDLLTGFAELLCVVIQNLTDILNYINLLVTNPVLFFEKLFQDIFNFISVQLPQILTDLLPDEVIDGINTLGYVIRCFFYRLSQFDDLLLNLFDGIDPFGTIISLTLPGTQWPCCVLCISSNTPSYNYALPNLNCVINWVEDIFDCFVDNYCDARLPTSFSGTNTFEYCVKDNTNCVDVVPAPAIITHEPVCCCLDYDGLWAPSFSKHGVYDQRITPDGTRCQQFQPYYFAAATPEGLHPTGRTQFEDYFMIFMNGGYSYPSDLGDVWYPRGLPVALFNPPQPHVYGPPEAAYRDMYDFSNDTSGSYPGVNMYQNGRFMDFCTAVEYSICRFLEYDPNSTFNGASRVIPALVPTTGACCMSSNYKGGLEDICAIMGQTECTGTFGGRWTQGISCDGRDMLTNAQVMDAVCKGDCEYQGFALRDMYRREVSPCAEVEALIPLASGAVETFLITKSYQWCMFSVNMTSKYNQLVPDVMELPPLILYEPEVLFTEIENAVLNITITGMHILNFAASGLNMTEYVRIYMTPFNFTYTETGEPVMVRPPPLTYFVFSSMRVFLELIPRLLTVLFRLGSDVTQLFGATGTLATSVVQLPETPLSGDVVLANGTNVTRTQLLIDAVSDMFSNTMTTIQANFATEIAFVMRWWRARVGQWVPAPAYASYQTDSFQATYSMFSTRFDWRINKQSNPLLRPGVALRPQQIKRWAYAYRKMKLAEQAGDTTTANAYQLEIETMFPNMPYGPYYNYRADPAFKAALIETDCATSRTCFDKTGYSKAECTTPNILSWDFTDDPYVEISTCTCEYVTEAGACCLYLNDTCINTVNQSVCIDMGGAFFLGSNCSSLTGPDDTNTTHNVCTLEADMLAAGLAACCVGVTYETPGCQMLTLGDCADIGGTWNPFVTCSAGFGLDQRCGQCETLFFPLYEITGNILCPDPYIIDIIEGVGSSPVLEVADTRCVDRVCWDAFGNELGNCADEPGGFFGDGDTWNLVGNYIIPEFLLNPVCGCQNYSYNIVSCCLPNGTCIEHYAPFVNYTQKLVECVSDGGTFKPGVNCSACPYINANASTWGACCYKDLSDHPRCALVADNTECQVLAPGEGTFNAGTFCDQPSLSGNCDHCGARGCRNCYILLDVLNTYVDSLIILLNDYVDILAKTPLASNATISALPQAVEAIRAESRYNQPSLVPQMKRAATIPPDSVGGYLITAIEFVFNLFWNMILGYDAVDLHAAIESVIDFVIVWNDPTDPNHLWYYLEYYRGALPFAIFPRCDYVDDVFKNSEVGGLGIWWGFIVTVILYVGTVFLLSLIFKGAILHVFHLFGSLYFGLLFLWILIAVAYNIPPGCSRPSLILYPGFFRYDFNMPEGIGANAGGSASAVAGAGAGGGAQAGAGIHLPIGWIAFPIYIPYPIPAFTPVWLPIIPKALPQDVVNFLTPIFTSNYTFPEVDCREEPWGFVDGFRGLAYLLKMYLPAVYCGIVEQTYPYLSWMMDIPVVAERLTFPGADCTDTSLISNSTWSTCFGFNAMEATSLLILAGVAGVAAIGLLIPVILLLPVVFYAVSTVLYLIKTIVLVIFSRAATQFNYVNGVAGAVKSGAKFSLKKLFKMKEKIE